MTCEEARRQIGGDPGCASPALREHLNGCAACTRFAEETQRLEQQLRRALCEAEASRRARAAFSMTTRRWALAASLVIAAGVAALIFGLRPSASLAAEVVEHVKGEPASWSSAQPAPAATVATILHNAGVSLSDPTRVVYARSCMFRGHEVPHLVVRTPHGPYTVMILRHEHIGHTQRFNEGGFSGMLIPAAGGTLAVLTLDGSHLNEVAAQVSRGVHWNE